MSFNLIFALVPYLAVGAGLFVFHSAWVAILTYHAVIAAVVWLSKPVAPFRQIIRCSNYKKLIFPAAIGAGGGIVLYLLWPLLAVPPDINAYMQSIGLTASTWPFFVAYYVLANACFEEYYWRGFLGSRAKHPVINDFLFAGYHLVVLAGKMGVPWLMVVFLVLGGAGWYWRQISRFTEGLLAAVLSHIAADITAILAIFCLTAKT